MKTCPLCKRNCGVFCRSLKGVDLLKCPSCTFVYADVADDVIEAYNSGFDDVEALSYEKHQTLYDKLWFDRIAVRFAKRFGTGRVLDVGCGNGGISAWLAKQGFHVLGIDYSAQAIERAERDHQELLGDRLAYEVMDICQSGWEKRGFTGHTTVSNGLVHFEGRWLLYYGAADRVIGLATCTSTAPGQRQTRD